MPADRLGGRPSPADHPLAAPATRSEYARRRLATAAGLQELRQWRRTAAVLAAYTAALTTALRYGAVAASTTSLHAAWVDLTDTRTITTAVVKAAFTVAVIFTLPLAGSAARVVVRLRPWRPHSGRSAMWSSPPQRLRTNWPAWRATAQTHMLTDHPTAPSPPPTPQQATTHPDRPAHHVEPEPETHPAEPEPEPEIRPVEPEPAARPVEPEPKIRPVEPEPALEPHIRPVEPVKPGSEPDEPEPESADPATRGRAAEWPLEPAADADARLMGAMAQVGISGPWTDDLAGEEPEEPGPALTNTPALDAEAEAAAAQAGPVQPEREPLVFGLFGPNKMSAERESMLALLVANNRRLHLKDGARILGLEPTTLRMRLTRAAKDGWTKHSGINHWTLSDRVTTELEMLITAVSDSDEHTAAHIADRIGPPLPALRADWIDNRAGGLTPREELRAAADTALASAAERWPTNTTFTDAVDRLYEDA